jgi:hypothetical protein
VLPYSDSPVTEEEGVGRGGEIVRKHILRLDVDWVVALWSCSEVNAHQPKQADATDS